MAALAAAMGGEIGIAVLDLTSGETYERNADAVFPQASLIKLPVLVELYRQDQEGQLRLTDREPLREQDKVGGEGVLRHMQAGGRRWSLADLAVLMMTISDNTAANILIDQVGMESVNRRLASWGLEKTRLRRRMMDREARRRGVENLSTPLEMAALLRRLHAGELLDAARTEQVLRLMAGVQSGPYRRRLPESLQAPCKDGNLEGIRTGAGLLLIPGRPVAWAIMARGLKDEPGAEEQLSWMVRSIYDYFSAR
jgi:beta-lactamase class A